eukprot:gb/GECG01003870.1/.p1 GENE.gb/GECG01003870.1/~~gb/GECG01003870.1/.p1  ORF type:complete len:315 (+),score=42.63 gb/GECG01003870.1/:1-945(+)
MLALKTMHLRRVEKAVKKRGTAYTTTRRSYKKKIQKKREQLQAEQAPFRPTTSKRRRNGHAVSRSQSASGRHKKNTFDRLYTARVRPEPFLRPSYSRQEAEDLRECTFKPNANQRSRSVPPSRQAGRERPVWERLHAESTVIERTRAIRNVLKHQLEADGCTFSPNTHSSGRLLLEEHSSRRLKHGEKGSEKDDSTERLREQTQRIPAVSVPPQAIPRGRTIAPSDPSPAEFEAHLPASNTETSQETDKTNEHVLYTGCDVTQEGELLDKQGNQQVKDCERLLDGHGEERDADFVSDEGEFSVEVGYEVGSGWE